MNRKPMGLALLLALALGSSSALAQDETPTAVTNQNRTGDLPFSTSVGPDVEHVDVASGNLIVRIPITSVPGRGMGYNFALNYDAMLWAVATRKNGGVTYQKWNIEKRDWLPAGGIGLDHQPVPHHLCLLRGDLRPERFRGTHGHGRQDRGLHLSRLQRRQTSPHHPRRGR